MTTDEAIAAIRSATDFYAASQIRNEVATEASKRLRPEADANAVRAVFFEVWGHELQTQYVAPRPPLYFTGD